MSDSFCSYPGAVFAFTFLCALPIIYLAALVVTVAWWFALFIPSVLLAYLWFFEDIPWRGRHYGHQMMPGGSLSYGGEKYECHSCKHIKSQLDCNYGSALTAEKYEHRDDWKNQFPCSLCWRSGAGTKQDLYKGPVRWAEGERP